MKQEEQTTVTATDVTAFYNCNYKIFRTLTRFHFKEVLNISASSAEGQEDIPAPVLASVWGLSSTEALQRSISLSKPRGVCSLALSSAACGSSPLSRSCQLSSEGGLPTASPNPTAAFVPETATLSGVIRAHSAGGGCFCSHSATGEGARGVMLQAGDRVCILLQAAAVDRAMAMVSGCEGVVAGVWKKSKGEPGI